MSKKRRHKNFHSGSSVDVFSMPAKTSTGRNFAQWGASLHMLCSDPANKTKHWFVHAAHAHNDPSSGCTD